MFRNIQGWEFIIILVVLLLLFGARKLPDLARSIGASAKEFRKGMEEGSAEEDEDRPTRRESSAVRAELSRIRNRLRHRRR